MPCQISSAHSQLSRPRGKNPFCPIALTMVQLCNDVVCWVHVGQHSLPLDKQQSNIKVWKSPDGALTLHHLHRKTAFKKKKKKTAPADADYVEVTSVNPQSNIFHLLFFFLYDYESQNTGSWFAVGKFIATSFSVFQILSWQEERATACFDTNSQGMNDLSWQSHAAGRLFFFFFFKFTTH